MDKIQQLKLESFPEAINGFSFTEYLAIFMGLIFALAVAEFFISIGHMIRDRQRYKGYWEFYLWIFVLLEIFIITWYVQWTRIPFLDDSLVYFMLMSIPNLVIFLIVTLFFPSTKGEDQIDLKIHFHKVIRPLFVLLACFLGTLVLTELVVQTPIGQVSRYGQTVYFFIAVANAIWPNKIFRTVFLIMLVAQEGFVMSFL